MEQYLDPCIQNISHPFIRDVVKVMRMNLIVLVGVFLGFFTKRCMTGVKSTALWLEIFLGFSIGALVGNVIQLFFFS